MIELVPVYDKEGNIQLWDMFDASSEVRIWLGSKRLLRYCIAECANG